MDSSQNFPPPSLSPPNYYPNPISNLTPPIQPGPRSYKSRKYRPCDFCRARQVACKIDIGPPCALCSSHNRQCTFVERPKKKRRPNTSSNGEGSGSGVSGIPAESLLLQLLIGIAPQFDVSSTQMSPGFIAYEQYNGLNEESPYMDPYLMMNEGRYGVKVRPLDSQITRSARFIGETGESNPYLLRHYRYDENDECTISKLTYRRIKPNQNIPGEKGEPPAVFMLADNSLAQKGEPRVEDDVLLKAQSDISAMFTPQEALRLIGLFFRFVYPYFPILSKSDYFQNGTLNPEILNTLSMSLLSAIYATALPFMLYDDLLATTIVHSPPPTHQLFRVSWIAVTQELHTPRLATLQACLLLLQRAPTNRFTTDTPWKTSLVGWTVSLAQILGLTRECGEWVSIPTWELALRKRLWWAVFIMDKWASLGAGMPSHIHNDDFDVLPLTESDLETDPAFLDPEDHHFRLLADLTLILSDIITSFYTLRSTSLTSSNFVLSLDLAQPLRSRLKSWNDSLPPAFSLRQENDSRVERLSGNHSLMLAYIVATMTLFRALLRPLENLNSVQEEESGIVGSRGAVRAGAKGCAREVVEFVEGLGRGALEGFWHSWSRANFAIASSFLMQLLVTSESEKESSEIGELVERWRWAMRIGSGREGSGLMSLGLLRLDGVLLENGSLRPVTG